MTEKTKNRKRLSAIITDAVFSFDPYIGIDAEDLTACHNKDLQNLDGCYGIIEALCDILKTAVET